MPAACGEVLSLVAPAAWSPIAAFNFTYLQNLQALAEVGEVTYFRPLADAALPPGTELVYSPGGYPELFAEALSRNTAMRASLAAYCASGGAAHAECGGLMYLGQCIITAQGQAFPVVGGCPAPPL